MQPRTADLTLDTMQQLHSDLALMFIYISLWLVARACTLNLLTPYSLFTIVNPLLHSGSIYRGLSIKGNIAHFAKLLAH